jgi:ABC-2 type transport system permease protein
MVVWDQDGSLPSREFISRFTGSRYFSLRGYVQNYREVEQAIDRGQPLIALIIPRDFAARLVAGRPTAVQLIVDGSDSNTATIATGYADVVVGTYSQDITVQAIQRTGPPATARSSTIQVKTNTSPATA